MTGAPGSLELVADPGLAVLERIERRVLWLAASMVHHANRVRPNPSGVKVGGHQASSASMTTIMTALWFHLLTADDRVSVKPHASPVLHAINALLGELDDDDLESLRRFGGLQSYPSRLKDRDTVDYSTGSVGIGATATIWGAIARRYAASRARSAGRGRQYCLLGDAELDEGAIWEAVFDPMVPQLGELVWIVDVNRQSLDRVVPRIAVGRIERIFEAAGWQVIPVRFGRRLEALMSEGDRGAALRRRVLEMENEEYQRLLRCAPAELRRRWPGAGAEAGAIQGLLSGLTDEELAEAFRNLGGHDLGALLEAFDRVRDDRPTVILAYTIKGYRLPTEGHPQNHSALLTVEQYGELARRLGEDPAAPWVRFDPESAEGARCAEVAARLRRTAPPAPLRLRVPEDLGHTPGGVRSTQSALGRTLLDLRRAAPEVAASVVTVSPDVSSSTNLAGWVDRVGVWNPETRPEWFADDPETLVHWREHPAGQHVELGIAECNLVGLIAELGANRARWGVPTTPIGVLYDPFVTRALEPWSFGLYAGGRSILVGTPSGVTLAGEGGAHQSVITPSIGLEQPGCVAYEPAFAVETEWVLLAAIAGLDRPDGRSAYLRLSTRPIDQALAAIPADPTMRERRRRDVVDGGYLLRRAAEPSVAIVTMGAVVPETLDAAERLGSMGIEVDVVCVTSPALLFEAAQAAAERCGGGAGILDRILPADRAVPMVTVLDGHPHTLSFLAGVRRVPARQLGVSEFGQSGALEDVYRHHGIDAGSQVHAVLDLVGR